ncbi:MAG: DUF5655 domain-containing protein [Chryseolinea sp.]
MKPDQSESLEAFISGKPAESVALFHHFVDQFSKFGKVQAIPAKTMIGIATPRKRIAYVTRIGKDFVHVVFPFPTPHHDNLCFEKIAQVPGDAHQFNHHLRIKSKQDVNKEVLRFMKLAYDEGI